MQSNAITYECRDSQGLGTGNRLPGLVCQVSITGSCVCLLQATTGKLETLESERKSYFLSFSHLPEKLITAVLKSCSFTGNRQTRSEGFYFEANARQTVPHIWTMVVFKANCFLSAGAKIAADCRNRGTRGTTTLERSEFRSRGFNYNSTTMKLQSKWLRFC